MSEIKFSKSHEWVKKDGDVCIIGITQHAVDELGDVVFVELPGIGKAIAKSASFGVVESVKAVSDLISPVNGSISAINETLKSSPEMVNQSPYEKGWMIKVTGVTDSDLNDLLSENDYNEFVSKEAGA
ncbi:MAG: glycine cleavage system protein GcvH [Elusimicrobiota bacterium]